MVGVDEGQFHKPEGKKHRTLAKADPNPVALGKVNLHSLQSNLEILMPALVPSQGCGKDPNTQSTCKCVNRKKHVIDKKKNKTADDGNTGVLLIAQQAQFCALLWHLLLPFSFHQVSSQWFSSGSLHC